MADIEHSVGDSVNRCRALNLRLRCSAQTVNAYEAAFLLDSPGCLSLQDITNRDKGAYLVHGSWAEGELQGKAGFMGDTCISGTDVVVTTHVACFHVPRLRIVYLQSMTLEPANHGPTSFLHERCKLRLTYTLHINNDSPSGKSTRNSPVITPCHH